MISAVVVNHNGGRYLARCLGSLAAAAAGGLEVVLVDNASGDGSVELVRRELGFVRVLEQAVNLGFGAATNLGVAAASGDPLLLLNPDAWLLDDGLETLVAALAADPGLAMVAPRLLYPEGRPQFVWAPDRGLLGEAVQKVRNRFEGWPCSHGALERVLRLLLGPGWLTAACLLVRRAAFEQVGGFDPGFFLYFEDVDLGLRLRRAGWRVAVVDAARACHVGGGGRLLGEQTTLQYRRSQLRFYRLHRPAWESRLLLWYLRLKCRGGPLAEWLRQAGKG